MIQFVFWFKPEDCRAGCVERVIIKGPFYKLGRNPQTGQPMPLRSAIGLPVGDVQAAARWLAGLGPVFPYPAANPMGAVSAACLTPDGQTWEPEGKAEIVSVQYTQPPVVSGQQVTADMGGQPVGNRGAGITQPPSVPAQRPAKLQPRDPLQATQYEPIDDAGLAVAADGMFDADAQAGTFTDINPNDIGPNGAPQERQRSLDPRPYNPQAQGPG